MPGIEFNINQKVDLFVVYEAKKFIIKICIFTFLLIHRCRNHNTKIKSHWRGLKKEKKKIIRLSLNRKKIVQKSQLIELFKIKIKTSKEWNALLLIFLQLYPPLSHLCRETSSAFYISISALIFPWLFIHIWKSFLVPFCTWGVQRNEENVAGLFPKEMKAPLFLFTDQPPEIKINNHTCKWDK